MRPRTILTRSGDASTNLKSVLFLLRKLTLIYLLSFTEKLVKVLSCVLTDLLAWIPSCSSQMLHYPVLPLGRPASTSISLLVFGFSVLLFGIWSGRTSRTVLDWQTQASQYVFAHCSGIIHGDRTGSYDTPSLTDLRRK